jgi:hypothetical protein
MMLLCPEHHDMATKGAMKEAKQRKFKANPHNMREGRIRGSLEIDHGDFSVRVGDTEFKVNGPLLLADGEPILGLTVGESGVLELSLNLYDRDDNKVLVIEKNEWKTPGPLWPWDIKSDWQVLRIRERKRHVLFAIDARENPPRLTLNCWRRGVNIQFQPKLGVWAGPPIKAYIKGGNFFKNVGIGVDTQAKQLHVLGEGMPKVVMAPEARIIFGAYGGFRSEGHWMKWGGP